MHAASLTGMLAFFGATPHVASALTERLKLPVVHLPPAPAQVQEQLGVPSPCDTHMIAVSPAGQLGRDVAAKFTGSSPRVAPGRCTGDDDARVSRCAVRLVEATSGNELHAARAEATKAVRH